MNIIAIIPARKGSKRLSHKNIRKICGKTLIEYAIDEAKLSKYITDIVISTDDPEVKRIASRFGIKYVERPKELCSDTATTQDVINHFIDWIPFDRKPDVIVLLQPTSPLRKVDYIDKCIELFINNSFDSVITVREISPHTYYPNGAVYVFKNEIYTKNMGFVLMTDEESIDINTYLDFKICELLIKND